MIKIKYKIKGALKISTAEQLAIEQSVEVPNELITPDIKTKIVGKITEIYKNRVTIEYPTNHLSKSPTALLNLLTGNYYMFKNVAIEKIYIPHRIYEEFGLGPKSSLKTIRKHTGNIEFPILATAIKPVGSPLNTLVKLAKNLAKGGIEIIKDDHNLFDPPTSPFKTRIQKIHQNVQEISGGKTLYFPHIWGTGKELIDKLDYLEKIGVKGILVAPFLIGLPTTLWISKNYNFFIMAHPSFSGWCMWNAGLKPEVVWGQLFPLYGADAVIFPHFKGRFPISRTAIKKIVAELRSHPNPSVPVPAGGMKIASLDSSLTIYGKDSILLIGGDLLKNNQTLYARKFREITTKIFSTLL